MQNYATGPFASRLSRGVLQQVARRAGRLALIIIAGAAISSCGRPQHKSQAAAQSSGAQATGSAGAAVPSPEEDFLRNAISNPVFFEAHLNNQNQICEPLNPTDAAQIVVQRADGHLTAYIDRITTSETQHSATTDLLHPTMVSQSTGLMSSGTCYSVEDSWIQKYNLPGIGLMIPLGSIKATSVDLVNEYDVSTGAGSAKARSYHVGYIVDGSASGGFDLSGVTGVGFTATCILVHDNVENRWAVQGCQSAN